MTTTSRDNRADNQYSGNGASAKHTPAPWPLSEYEEHLGYDCMTGGFRAGPVVLDGGDYGQRPCQPISDEALALMRADARLISAAPELLKFAELVEHYGAMREQHGCNNVTPGQWEMLRKQARAAISKATNS